MVKTSRKIPNGWELCKPIGAVISGTKIFAFKTPLLPELQNKITKTYRFTTADLIQALAAKGKSLGLIINCSNTRRYYNCKDIEAMNIAYREIFCPGRGFLHRSDLTKDFNNIIDEFLLENNDNDLFIGIHCSDGINRSGYLICNYLICKLGWSSHDALNAFESARGYSIQRGSYIQALHKADSDRRKSENPTSFSIFKLDIKSSSSDNSEFLKNQSNEKKALSAGDVDVEMTPQVMQQLYQLEQQFKQATQSTITEPSLLANTALSLSSMNTYPIEASEQIMNQSSNYNESSTEIEADYVSEEYEDEEGADDDSPNIDFESMGRVDMKEPPSKSALRRKRRQNRGKFFAAMKKGRLWEINEAKKQMK